MSKDNAPQSKALGVKMPRSKTPRGKTPRSKTPRGKAAVILMLVFVFALDALLFSCTEASTPASAEITVQPQETGPEQLNLLLAGDLMCQRRQQKAAFDGKEYDFSYAFDYIREILDSGDIVIGNLETPVSTSNPLAMERRKINGQPYLNAPEAYLDALRGAGFDVLVNGNNHNCDTGIQGLKETLAFEDQYGFLRTGMFSDQKEARWLMLEKKGFKIGLASYATYFNDTVLDFTEEEQNIHLNYYSKEKVNRDIAEMREAGAEFVIIYFHSGKEMSLQPTAKQQRIAWEIANAGADYILCSHSHTVQPVTTVTNSEGKQVPVAYALGNFISHMTKKRISAYGLLLSLTLARDENGDVVIADQFYYPLRVLTKNPETGKKYQLLPCTVTAIKSCANQKLRRKLQTGRREILASAGSEIPVK